MFAPVVIVESPFRGTFERPEKNNRLFLLKVLKHYTFLGFNPIASHAYYVDFLDDKKQNERVRGLGLGRDIYTRVDPIAVTFHLYDAGELSDGMAQTLSWCQGQLQRRVPITLTRWNNSMIAASIEHLGYST